MNREKKQQKLTEIDDELMGKLQFVYVDPQIDQRPDLKNMIRNFMIKLQETDDLDLVLSLLYKQIALQFILDSKNFPESIVDLYYFVRMRQAECDGLNWSATQAGLTWFE